MVTETGLAKARLLVEAKRADEAAELLTTLLAAHPGDADAWYLLAVARLDLRDHAQALRAVEAHLELRAEHAAGWRLRGAVLKLLGRLPEAAQSLQRCVALAPQDSGGYAQLADVLRRDPRALPTARTMAEHAVRLGPQKSTNHLIHGVVALEQGDAAIAVTAFQEALRLNPQSAELHRNLALARLRLGAARQTVAAVTGFADAVRADPGFRLAVPNLADAVYRLVTKGWLLALGTLVCGMVTGTLVDRFVLTGSDPAYTAGHWAAIAVAVAVTAVPGVAVAVALLRRIPGTLRPGIARIGLRPWRTRVRSAGLAVAVAGGVVTPAVTFFPVAPFAGLAMGVLFLVARRPRSGGLG